VYKRIGIPIVFDYHHHMLHPGGQTEQEALELALSTWGDIKPVVHYAESRSLEHDNPKIKPQAHSDMLRRPYNDYGNDFDTMLECKFKEVALLEYRAIMNEQRTTA
jgi:UV DNA damage endonuclease